MSTDSAYPTFQHYGTNAQRLAFTPAPPATQPIYQWYESDTDTTWIYTTSWHQVSGSGGGVTASGTLTANNVILGNGTSVVKALGSLGTTTTLLHGNAAGAPTFATVVEADITLADNTTNDVSTSKHGLFPKLPSGVPGVLLGYTLYNPNTAADVTTSSTAYADVDATNLTVTFTVPVSGNILIRLSAVSLLSSGSTAHSWNLRTPGGSDVTGTNSQVSSAGTNQTRPYYVAVLTGLTPGTSTTYRWGHAISATAATGNTRYGGTGSTARGPAVMEVWSA